jgi:hypothetical protein
MVFSGTGLSLWGLGLAKDKTAQAEACATDGLVVPGAGKAYDSRELNSFKSEISASKGPCHEERRGV